MKQTLAEAAEQYGRRIDGEHPSNAATDFLAGVAWQKQHERGAFKKMMEALQLCLKDLDSIITNEFGEMEAADYPSIVKAKAALSAVLD